MTKEKNKVDQLEQIKFDQIEGILQILGLIETRGILFQKDNPNITQRTIEDFLEKLGSPDGKDNRRQIKNAQNIFNRLSKDFLIDGDRSGTNYKNRKTGEIATKGLREDKAYQTLVVIYLSLLLYQDSLHLDFLAQFLELEHPLDFLTSIQYAIKNKHSISFEYRSDRNNRNSTIDPFLPVKIYFKDNHWFVIGWDEHYKSWNQYLIHSIKNLSLSSIKIEKEKTKKFDFKSFRKNSFGTAILNNVPVTQIDIEVPSSIYNAVFKRRKEGKWNKTSEPYIWTVETYDKNEIFDYIFRWNGLLKIKSPKEMKQAFQDKLKKFLD